MVMLRNPEVGNRYSSKGDQAIEAAEPEPVSSIGAENWYGPTLWAMETIFNLNIDIEAYLLVHPDLNSSELWYIVCHNKCDIQFTTSRYYFELDGPAYMCRYQI